MSNTPSNVQDATASSWQLSEELLALQDVVRSFVRQEVRPAEDEHAEPDAVHLPAEVEARLQAKARQAGLWCIGSPAEYGGGGFNVMQRVVIAEEAAQCRLGIDLPAAGAFGNDPPSVIFHGTESQIERYGIPAVEEGRKTFIAISEPSGGSDPARSIQTTAKRTSQGWLLNGTKTWISGADEARWGIVFARTGEGRHGISSFIVETDQPGVVATPIPVIRPWAPCELSLTDVEVPEENLLGEEGLGFQLAQQWLVYNRVPYAAGVIGVAQAALDLATAYAKDRVTFGSPLADKQAIQWMVADSEIELRAARLLTYQAAGKADRGEDFKTDASIAKVFATEAAGRVIDRCVQIFGGMGLAKELPLERWYRELRVKRIGEGPSEVHRMVVAREVLHGPRRKS